VGEVGVVVEHGVEVEVGGGFAEQVAEVGAGVPGLLAFSWTMR
jgi:hypothetical protein